MPPNSDVSLCFVQFSEYEPAYRRHGRSLFADDYPHSHYKGVGPYRIERRYGGIFNFLLRVGSWNYYYYIGKLVGVHFGQVIDLLVGRLWLMNQWRRLNDWFALLFTGTKIMWELVATWNRFLHSLVAPCTLRGSPLSLPSCSLRPRTCWPGSNPASVWRIPPRPHLGSFPKDMEVGPFVERTRG